MKKIALSMCLILILTCLFGCSSSSSDEKGSVQTDNNNYDTIIEATNTALADVGVLKESMAGFVIKGSADGWTIVGEAPKFTEQMEMILGKGWAIQLKLTATKSATITVSGGMAERTEMPK